MKHFASIVFGLCFLMFFLGLVFSKSFRSDFLQPQAGGNEVNILGLSAKGSVIVMIVVLIGACLFFLNKPEAPAPNLIGIQLNELPFVTTTKESALTEISRLKNIDREGSSSLLKQLQSLNYVSPQSSDIRDLATKGEGPWNYSAIEFLMTVPPLSQKTAHGCNDARLIEFEVASRLQDSATKSGKPTRIVFSDSPIISGSEKKCRETHSFFQISCDLAVQILGNEVLSCNEQNVAKWADGYKPPAPIYFTRDPDKKGAIRSKQE